MPITNLQAQRTKPTDKDQKISAGKGMYLLVKKLTGAKYWRMKYRYAGKENERTVDRRVRFLAHREGSHFGRLDGEIVDLEPAADFPGLNDRCRETKRNDCDSQISGVHEVPSPSPVRIINQERRSQEPGRAS